MGRPTHHDEAVMNGAHRFVVGGGGRSFAPESYKNAAPVRVGGPQRMIRPSGFSCDALPAAFPDDPTLRSAILEDAEGNTGKLSDQEQGQSRQLVNVPPRP